MEADGIELVTCIDVSLSAMRDALAVQLEPGQPLRRFSFRGLASVRACCWFADHVLVVGTITELVLTDGVLDDQRTRILCDALADRSSGYALSTLDVSDNDMGDNNFESLILALRRHPYLRSLRATHDSLGSFSVALLCSMYASFGALRELDLSRNRLTGEAGLNLGRYISRDMLHIRFLRLRTCNIKGAGLQALLDVRDKLDALDVSDKDSD